MSEQSLIKSKPRTLIHIGAGDGKRLNECLKRGPEKIVLVEAERSALTRLKQRVSKETNVQVIEAVLGQAVGEAELSIWNFSRLNSIQEPTAELRDLFPGLMRKDRQVVPVITPARLMSEIGAIASPLSVIVETPGNEMVFLTACRADGVLEQIDELEILLSEDVFFEGSTTRAKLEEWLVNEGFVVAARDDGDADWTVLHLYADRTARALSKAEARIAGLAKTLAERDAALKAAQERATGLEAVVAEAQAATEAKAKTLAERDAALKAAQERTTGLEVKVTDQGKLRHSAEQKRDEVIATLDFQTRFQAMLQVDLEHLRGRLEQSETQRQRQEDLLGKLTAKLSLAAEYLRQLPPNAQAEPGALPATKVPSSKRGKERKKPKAKAMQGPDA